MIHKSTISKNIIDKYVKILPLLIFLFLLINFIFNSGYFFIIGNKFLSLLTLSDYYEGSAPLIVITILSFALIFNTIFLNNHVRASYMYLNLLLSSKIYVPLRALRFNFKRTIHFKLNRSKYTYNDRKKLIKAKKDYEKFQNEIVQNFKDLNDIKPLINWVLICIILLPILIIFINSFLVSIRLFYLLLILYICIIITASQKKGTMKYYFLTILTIIFIFCLGVWQFLRDYKLDTMSYMMNKQEKYQVIRPISKGILVKQEKNILFIDWNNNLLFSSNQPDLIDFLITDSDLKIQQNVNNTFESHIIKGKF